MKQPFVFTQVVRQATTTISQKEKPESTQKPLTQLSTWSQRAGARARYYSFEETPTLTRTPWEVERSKKHPQAHLTRRKGSLQLPAHVFEQLPHEIYSCILGHLEAQYTKGPAVDIAGRKQALLTLCLTSKRWAKVAIEHLYCDLVLPSNSNNARQKRTRRLSITKPKSQLDILLRTLNEAPSLAFLIRRIQIPTALAKELAGEDVSLSQRRAAHRSLRDVLEICTEVEFVSGYTAPATQEYAEWFGLLFSCERIRAHAWLLSLDQAPVFNYGQFVDLHERWEWLETLVLCKNDFSDASMGPGIISGITRRLCSLKHLMVSNFGKDDFHNGTLLSLGPLNSLRLENLDGVTDQGLAQFASSPNAYSLESLSLINLELTSLRTLQQLLQHLTRLRRLRFVQNTSPTLLPGTSQTSNRNSLASKTLQYLHWDTLIAGGAIFALARSISSASLPNLRELKVPSDTDGSLQALCRPIHRCALTASDVQFLNSVDMDRCTRSLRLSRLQAQLRVRESRRRPSMSVVISDEAEQTQHTHVIGSYLGDVTSRIEYLLEPDVKGKDEALASLGDVARTRNIGTDSGEMCGFGVLF